MRSFRDGFNKPKIIRNKEQLFPRSFANGFDRPIEKNNLRIMSIPFTSLYWADRISGTNGDSIPIWKDSKGVYDAISISPTEAMLTKNISAINGHAAITFDGTQAYQNALIFVGQPRTVVVVFNVTNFSRFHYITDSAETTYRNLIGWRDSSPDYVVISSDGPNSISYNKALSSTYIMLTAVFNGSSSKIYENGVLKVTNNAGSNAMHGITLGMSFGYSTTNSMIGNLALCGIANSELTGSDLSRMHQIIMGYYGL